jgi:Xaa-Pro aminopeptidase
VVEQAAVSQRDPERRARVQQALKEFRLDALVCALPANVVMLTGYWPVVGSSVAIATRDGELRLLVPQDEHELAEGHADGVSTFQPHTLEHLGTAVEALREPLAKLGKKLKLNEAKIGHEAGAFSEPASYSSIHVFGNALRELLQGTFSDASLQRADDLLLRLRATKTPREIDRLRRACEAARNGFVVGCRGIKLGRAETEVAAIFRAPMLLLPPGGTRASAFTWCMSGPNAALASAAFARSQERKLERGDLVLVHCNSTIDGFWTDVTRTYCFELDERKRKLYEAVLAAREEAIMMVRAGTTGRDVDAGAREVMRAHGLADAFRHGTGHEVGFGAIDVTCPPRIHPASEDVLEEGMTFNLEPAGYFDGYGGLRQCEMVAIVNGKAELLTPFHRTMEELTLDPQQLAEVRVA